VVAARMGTSEAAVARLEAAIVDPRASTIERFAAAVGKRIQWEIVDARRDVHEP
jgi:predicted transcriptional regulator